MGVQTNVNYSITLTPNQVASATKAVQLFIDLKDHKIDVIFPLLVEKNADRYKEREANALLHLKEAFGYVFVSKEPQHDDQYDKLQWLLKKLKGKNTQECRVIEMPSTYAHIFNGAIELLMRLKLNQPNELIYSLINLGDNDYCDRRDSAEPLLRCAFKQIYPTFDSVKKDSEWYRLYNIYQVLRYAFYKAENPLSKGVDSYPPTSFSGEPLPKLTYIKE